MSLYKNKNYIDTLSNEIISLQDKIKELEYDAKNYKTRKQSYIDALEFDIEKNKQRVQTLKRFLAEDKDKQEKEITRREMDRNELKTSLIEIECDIKFLKSRDREIIKGESKKVEETIREYESLLEQCEEERGTLESNLNQLNSEFNEANEQLRMMKEEKEGINRDIVNVISYKESYEEIINCINFDNNNENIENDLQESVELKRMESKSLSFPDVELFQYEINALSGNIFAKRLHDVLGKFVDLNSNSFREKVLVCLELLKNQEVEKDVFYRKLNKEILSSWIWNSDKKKQLTGLSDYPVVNLEGKLNFLFKLSLKLCSYDQTITSNMNFLNKTYKSNKEQMNQRLKEIDKEISRNMDELDRLEIRENEFRSMIDEFIEKKESELKYRPSTFPKSNSENVKMLELRFESLQDLKTEIDSEIEELTKKYELKIKTYQEQIDELLLINGEIEKRKRDAMPDIEDFYAKTESEIGYLKELITEKYEKIADALKQTELDNILHENLVSHYVGEINEALTTNKKKKTQNNEDAYNTIAFKYNKVGGEFDNKSLQSNPQKGFKSEYQHSKHTKHTEESDFLDKFDNSNIFTTSHKYEETRKNIPPRNHRKDNDKDEDVFTTSIHRINEKLKNLDLRFGSKGKKNDEKEEINSTTKDLKQKLLSMKSKVEVANQEANSDTLQRRHRNRNENKSALIITKNESFIIDTKLDKNPHIHKDKTRLESNPTHDTLESVGHLKNREKDIKPAKFNNTSDRFTSKSPIRSNFPSDKHLKLNIVNNMKNANANEKSYLPPSYRVGAQTEDKFYGRYFNEADLDKSPRHNYTHRDSKNRSKSPLAQPKTPSKQQKKSIDHTPERPFNVKDQQFLQKIQPLFTGTMMYLRKSTKYRSDFDLLSFYSPQECSFGLCQGSVDKQVKKFIFTPTNNDLDYQEIDLLLVNKIIVTKQTKNKIILLQLAKKQEKLANPNQEECLNEDKNKAYLQSRYFIFYLELKNGERVEIILTSYENFKVWINGISTILQNKSFHF